MKKAIIVAATILSMSSCYQEYDKVPVFRYKRTDSLKIKNDLDIVNSWRRADLIGDCYTIAHTARDNKLDAYIVFDSVGNPDVYVYDPKKTTKEKDLLKKLNITQE